MAKCIYCEKVKGKRPCPALDGAICSRCCGEHQGEAIVCPESCPYLRHSEVPDHEAYQGALTALVEFALKEEEERDHALRTFLGGDEAPAEWEEGALLGWVAYGHRDAGGELAVDRMLRERGGRLDAAGRGALEALREAFFSYSEITAVEPDQGLELTDLISGEKLRVSEKMGSRGLRLGEVLIAWIVPIGDRYELAGSLALVPTPFRAELDGALREALEAERERSPDLDDSELMRRCSPAAFAALRHAVAGFEPKLTTDEGDPIVFCAANYLAGDAEACRARIAEHPDMRPSDEDRSDFDWVGVPGGDEPSEEPTVLGRIKLGDGALTLHCISRERIARGRSVLDPLLEGVAEFADLDEVDAASAVLD